MAAIISAQPHPGGLATPLWLWVMVAATTLVLWAVAMEASTISTALAGTPEFLHELFHDGRHLLGVPCH